MRADFGVAYQLDLEHLQVDVLAALAHILQQKTQGYVSVARQDSRIG